MYLSSREEMISICEFPYSLQRLVAESRIHLVYFLHANYNLQYTGQSGATWLIESVEEYQKH
jgi:hypothetical protein